MKTSSANTISPGTEITPDFVGQKSSLYGIAAEVKKSLPMEREHWRDSVLQLRKYDDALSGWWTAGGLIGDADAVLLVHDSRSRALVQYINELLLADPNIFGPKSAVVEFGQSNEREVYIRFRLEKGAVRDSDLAGVLGGGIPVPLQKVLETYGNLKFYDAKPAIENLMVMLWLDALPSHLDAAPIDPDSGLPNVIVSVSELTNELQQAYGSQAVESDRSSVSFPKADWIREALDALVRIKLAARADEADTYVVPYRALAHEDLLMRFCRLSLGHAAMSAGEDGQLDLLAER